MYLQERGVSISGYLETSLVEITSAVEIMAFPVVQTSKKIKTMMQTIK